MHRNPLSDCHSWGRPKLPLALFLSSTRIHVLSSVSQMEAIIDVHIAYFFHAVRYPSSVYCHGNLQDSVTGRASRTPTQRFHVKMLAVSGHQGT